MCYVFLTLPRNHRCVEEKNRKRKCTYRKEGKKGTKVDGQKKKTKKKNEKQKLTQQEKVRKIETRIPYGKGRKI